MFDSIFPKLYFLFLFLLIYLISFHSYLTLDGNIVFLWILGILTFIWKNIWDTSSEKNFSLVSPKFYLPIFIWMITISLFQNAFYTCIILLYLFYFFFQKEMLNFFLLWVGYFFLFLISYFSGYSPYTYSIFFTFFMYSLLLGNSFYFHSWYKITHQTAFQYILLFLSWFFTLSLYIEWLWNIFLGILFLIICLWEFQKTSFYYKYNFKSDLLILWIYFIIFIPLINDKTLLEDKNQLLLFTSIWFFLSYIWYSLVLQKYFWNRKKSA